MSERTINFDTHRFVKRLVESGLAAVCADLESGLAAVRADLESGLAAVRAEIKSGLAATEARLMRWMAGLLIAQGGVIVTLISLFG